MQTYQNVRDAYEALRPVMKQKGLSGATQIALMRLWRALAEPAATYAETELAAVREFGRLKDDGKTIEFRDSDAKAGYMAKLAAMNAAEIAPIPPVRLAADPALFAATTPEALAALEPFIILEGSEEA